MSNSTRKIGRSGDGALPETKLIKGKVFHRVTCKASEYDDSGCPRRVEVMRDHETPTVESDDVRFYVIYVPANMIPPEVN